ncbi:MAG: hypothetical protein NVS2B9_18820 [Myxococcales bacterium]
MLRTLGLALCAFALAACNAKPQYPECKADADCSDRGQVCVAGFCKECREDAQCKPGAVCKDNACSAGAQCTAARDCQPEQRCTAGKCAPECSEKTAAQDCGDGRRCLSGRCAAQEECVADADCGSGKACENAVCKVQGSAEVQGEAQAACELKPITFGFDDATVDRAARDVLEEDWRCLSRSKFARLEIAGHTDERGTTEYNLALGSRRAAAVRKVLVGAGADAKKLRAVSYGKEKPVDRAHDESAWSKNRRVELTPGR